MHLEPPPLFIHHLSFLFLEVVAWSEEASSWCWWMNLLPVAAVMLCLRCICQHWQKKQWESYGSTYELCQHLLLAAPSLATWVRISLPDPSRRPPGPTPVRVRNLLLWGVETRNCIVFRVKRIKELLPIEWQCCLNLSDSQFRVRQQQTRATSLISWPSLGLRKKVKDGNLPVIYQGQKKGV